MKRVYIAILIALVAISCNQAGTTAETAEDLRVRFSATVGTYSVKATDNAFENGDAISVAALLPISETNVKYVFRDGALYPEDGEGIKWVSGQKTASSFYAVYPYREDFSLTTSLFGDMPGGGLLMTIRSDQSTKEGYDASNLMRAWTNAKPGETVELNFSHAVSKIIINIENSLTDGIKEVYLTDVYGRYVYLDSEQSGVNGNTGTVKAMKFSESDWRLFLTPQSATPTVVVVTESGAEYPFTSPSTIRIATGRQMTFNITLDSSTQAVIVPSIQEWSDDPEITFDNDVYLRRLEYGPILGDYTMTAENYWNGEQSWTINLSLDAQENGKIWINNLFGNDSWAGTDMMFYGILNQDNSMLSLPYGQTTEYIYKGFEPFYLYGFDGEDVVMEGTMEVAIIREAGSDIVTGLDFGDAGLWVLTWTDENHSSNANLTIVKPGTMYAEKVR